MALGPSDIERGLTSADILEQKIDNWLRKNWRRGDNLIRVPDEALHNSDKQLQPEDRDEITRRFLETGKWKTAKWVRGIGGIQSFELHPH